MKKHEERLDTFRQRRAPVSRLNICAEPCIVRSLAPNYINGCRNCFTQPTCCGTGSGPMPCRKGLCAGIVRPRILNAL